ncbi:Protein angel 2, partial [Rhizophlyctis rosea]
MAKINGMKKNHLEFSRASAYLGCNVEYHPTAVAVQECDSAIWPDLKMDLRGQGYEGYFSHSGGMKVDGVALFFDTKSFKVVESESMRFDDQIKNAGLMVVAKVLHKEKPGQIKPPEQEIIFATTQLSWSPSSNHLKMLQLQTLLATMYAKVVEREKVLRRKVPVVLCGDFNILPYSPLYHFLRTGHMDNSTTTLHWSGQSGLPHALRTELLTDAANSFEPSLGPYLKSMIGDDGAGGGDRSHESQQPLRVYSHQLRLQSAYAPYLHFEDDDPYVSTYHDKARGLVDFVFYSGVEASAADVDAAHGDVADGYVADGEEEREKGKDKGKGKEKDEGSGEVGGVVEFDLGGVDGEGGGGELRGTERRDGTGGRDWTDNLGDFDLDEDVMARSEDGTRESEESDFV